MSDTYDSQIAITTVRSWVRDLWYKLGRTVKNVFNNPDDLGQSF